MKKLLILSILIIFGCDNSTNPDCADGGISCGFNANIILMNNSIPLTGADVFIMYNNNPSFNNPGLQRPNTTIIYDIPSEGNVKINEYDLDDNLIRNIVDGLMSPGRYNTSIVSMNYFAPFGLCVTKIALEFNDELLTQYPVFMTIPDFSQTINLGQTDDSGQLILNSDFLTSYNIPTFYNTPNIMQTDA